MLVYLRDGSAQTTVRAPTLRQNLQINFLSYPVIVYWHQAKLSQRSPYTRQAPGKVATWVQIFKLLYDSKPEKFAEIVGVKPQVRHSQGIRLNH